MHYFRLPLANRWSPLSLLRHSKNRQLLAVSRAPFPHLFPLNPSYIRPHCPHNVRMAILPKNTRITRATIAAAWKQRNSHERQTIRDTECGGLALLVGARTRPTNARLHTDSPEQYPAPGQEDWRGWTARTRPAMHQSPMASIHPVASWP